MAQRVFKRAGGARAGTYYAEPKKVEYNMALSWVRPGVYRAVVSDGWATLYGARGRKAWECNATFLRYWFNLTKRKAGRR